jgi:hypothetical protein
MLKDDQQCPRCELSLRGAQIPEKDLHCYNHGPNGEFLATYEDFLAVRDQIVNPTTHFSRVIGIEYDGLHPDHHDGVSEWQCPNCGYREGRWTGNALADGDFEPRYGKPRDA